MPIDRKILQNVVNNDLKVAGNDVKTGLNETKALNNEVSKMAHNREGNKFSTNNETKKFSANNETKKVSLNNETKKVSLNNETKKVVFLNETKKLSLNNETKKVSSNNETKKVVFLNETKKMSSKIEAKKGISNIATKKVVSNNATKKSLLKNATKKGLPNNETKDNVSDNETKKCASDNETKECVSDNETKEECSSAFDEIATDTALMDISDDSILMIDEGDESNEFLMSEYTADIYNYLYVLEQKFAIKEDFMGEQKEITPRMRSILINWLVQVHNRFHLHQETLYFAVSILDSYIQRAQVAKNKFQLLGVTSLWLASKCEEIYVPSTVDFLYVTDHAYTQKDVEEMEITILKVLDFNIGRPLHIHFLRRYSKAGQVDVEVHNLSKFLIELSISDYQLSSNAPSIVAAAALCLSRKIYDGAAWTKNLAYHSTYSDARLHPVVCKLACLLTNMATTKLTATQLKYAHPNFFNISRSKLLTSPLVLQLAANK